MKKVMFVLDVDVEKVVVFIFGFFGVDFVNFVNEVVLFVMCCKVDVVMMDDFNNVLECIIVGLEKKNCVFNLCECEIVVYYEMGYVLVVMVLLGVDLVYKVLIILCGIGVFGYIIQCLIEDCFLMMWEEFENKIVVLFGGCVVEKIIYDYVLIGVVDDLVKVIDIVCVMVVWYGMDEEFGYVSYDSDWFGFFGIGDQLFWLNCCYSDVIVEWMDVKVCDIVDGVFKCIFIFFEINLDFFE